ncbi:hypothetical protein E6O75_ATG01260 [Venturia nashicola]|uniref:Uncharacterized protein n=1 Tax=Venturia nashicola TaxID=86259 RepID=A0A4Z1PTZ2_9PEZI|nr:hypothetical protein E6O75_ATG01260 [Venturia nashicola]
MLRQQLSHMVRTGPQKLPLQVYDHTLSKYLLQHSDLAPGIESIPVLTCTSAAIGYNSATHCVPMNMALSIQKKGREHATLEVNGGLDKTDFAPAPALIE